LASKTKEIDVKLNPGLNVFVIVAENMYGKSEVQRNFKFILSDFQDS
jgi:hypothetical protein